MKLKEYLQEFDQDLLSKLEKETDSSDEDSKEIPTEETPVPEEKKVPEEKVPGEEEELKVSAVPVDPMSGEAPPEPPEFQDTSLLPYNDKVGMFIDMMKQYGYSSFDIDSSNGKTAIVIDGDIRKDIQSNIKKMEKETKLKVDIKKEKINDNDFMTRVEIENKMDYKTFRDVLKVMNRQEKEKENLMMGGSA